MIEKPVKKTFPPISPDVEQVGRTVLDAAYKIHTALGPGLLENVYESCLAYEIRRTGTGVDTQLAVPVVYEDIRVESGLRLDMLVGNCVVVEIKAVEKMNPLYEAQLLTYLKMTQLRLGYLINFNVLHLKDGVKRFVR
jgi:GxxExxY protein